MGLTGAPSPESCFPKAAPRIVRCTTALNNRKSDPAPLAAHMRIHSVNGPVVKVKNAPELVMMEMVYVGARRLIGEVISVDQAQATIQVYEGTTGLKPGEPVEGTGAPWRRCWAPASCAIFSTASSGP